MLEYFWLVPLFPLAGFLLLGLWGKRFSIPVVSLVSCGSVAVSFIIAAGSFLTLIEHAPDARLVKKTLFTWIASGNFSADYAFQLDPLSCVMMLVVTGVGFLIHVYSVGYMKGDGGYYRFFAYLNLFMFSMLTLVLGSNFLILFIGWEGVGLCSYLLIGFWFHKQSAADAGKKAFIVNRIGDAGFLLGVLLVYRTFGTLEFTGISAAIASTPAKYPVEFAWVGTLTAICLLLFIGATGKSAQIPLYVWLPDAMEGPTPVSALIHAATMVTAGVYLVTRSSVLFTRAPLALAVVATIGILTAIFAATIGLVQRDIKRVLAYSTVSQLGYMFTALGVGAFTAGMFHLVTHAFFKALLFLGAGSVIHGLSGEQDLQRMGNLRKYQPITHATMLIGVLAIAGIPGFSGFFSKDEILWKALEHGKTWIWVLGVAGACLTAFYTTRLLLLTFWGQERIEHERKHHLHESPAVMWIPLAILAALSFAGGYIGLPEWLGHNRFAEFLEPTIATVPVTIGLEENLIGEIPATLISVGVALLGVMTAFFFYIRRPQAAEALSSRFPGVYRLLLEKYRVDEFYNALIVAPLVGMSRLFLWRFTDAKVIDGAVNGTGTGLGWFGGLAAKLQNGFTRSYAAWIFAGTILILMSLLSQ
jgi:NADH-quinone oxidoreductase subunit L